MLEGWNVSSVLSIISDSDFLCTELKLADNTIKCGVILPDCFDVMEAELPQSFLEEA
jgi:hypothetical protein